MRIDTNLGMRAALVQAGAVLVLGLATGLTLSHSFFEDWGWLVGPGAWMLAAVATALILRLPLAGDAARRRARRHPERDRDARSGCTGSAPCSRSSSSRCGAAAWARAA